MSNRRFILFLQLLLMLCGLVYQRSIFAQINQNGYNSNSSNREDKVNRLITEAKEKLKGMSPKDLINILESEDKETYIRIAASKLLAEIGTYDLLPSLKRIYNKLGNEMKFSIPNDSKMIIRNSIPYAYVNIYLKTQTNDSRERINILFNLRKKYLDSFDKKTNPGDEALLSSGAVDILQNSIFNREEIDEILKYKTDKDPRIRQLVISSLINNINELTLDVIKEFLNDSHWACRYYAIKAIEKSSDKSAIPILKNIVNNRNEHEKVREAAEKAIEVLSK